MQPPDNFIEALKYAEPDLYPKIRQLLIIVCVSPFISPEAEHGASSVHRLKTPYRSTMSDKREGDLHLIQLQMVPDVDETDVSLLSVLFHLQNYASVL